VILAPGRDHGYALADKVLPVAQAIRSASGLPADILRLPRRGYLKAGYFADVVVLDPATFRDLATFETPHQQSTGVRFDSSWEGERPRSSATSWSGSNATPHWGPRRSSPRLEA
jgi:N-acyl-D-aspartate/D-glutamate deacylase